jgi:hypothetical protein
LVKNALYKAGFAAFSSGYYYSGFLDSLFGILAIHLPKCLNSFSRPTNNSGSPIFSVKGYCMIFLDFCDSSDVILS